ncbi:MAG: aa3-type cytochrome c oxidase subunit IV [Pseudomonadota bacterium]
MTEDQQTAKDSAMDYPEHEKTFNLFVGLTKYGTIAVIVILILMALFLL